MSPNKINGVVLHRLLRLRLVMFAVVVFSMIAAIDVINIVHSKQNTSIMEMCMLQRHHSATSPRGVRILRD